MTSRIASETCNIIKKTFKIKKNLFLFNFLEHKIWPGRILYKRDFSSYSFS